MRPKHELGLNVHYLFFAVSNAFAEGQPPPEDIMKVADRIEWAAGGLYDGRFDDGTRFQN